MMADVINRLVDSFRYNYYSSLKSNIKRRVNNLLNNAANVENDVRFVLVFAPKCKILY